MTVPARTNYGNNYGNYGGHNYQGGHSNRGNAGGFGYEGTRNPRSNFQDPDRRRARRANGGSHRPFQESPSNIQGNLGGNQDLDAYWNQLLWDASFNEENFIVPGPLDIATVYSGEQDPVGLNNKESLTGGYVALSTKYDADTADAWKECMEQMESLGGHTDLLVNIARIAATRISEEYRKDVGVTIPRLPANAGVPIDEEINEGNRQDMIALYGEDMADIYFDILEHMQELWGCDEGLHDVAVNAVQVALATDHLNQAHA